MRRGWILGIVCILVLTGGECSGAPAGGLADPGAKGAAWLNSALGHCQRGEMEAAIQCFLQAVAEYKTAGRDKDCERALSLIGVSYRHLGQFDKAASYFGEALALARKIGDRTREEFGLNSLGVSYRQLRQYDKAISCYQQALAIERQNNDRKEEAASSYNLGIAHFCLGQYAPALAALQQALSLRRKLKDRAGERTALALLGETCDHLDRRENAIAYYQQALSLDQQLQNREGQIWELDKLSAACEDLKQYDRDLDYRQRLLALYREAGDRTNEWTVLSGLGDLYVRLGRYGEAAASYQEALSLAREEKNRLREGMMLGSLGDACSHLSQDDKAIACYQRAVVVFHEMKIGLGEAAMLRSLGQIFRRRREFEKAIASFQKALRLEREEKDAQGEGSSLNDLASDYAGLGRYEEAIRYFRQALAVERAAKDEKGEGETLNNLGSVYSDIGHLNKSVQCLRKALAIEKDLQNVRAEKTTLTNLGKAFVILGRYDEALRYDREALAMEADARDPTTIDNLGVALARLGQAAQAISLFNEALRLQRQAGDRAGEACSLTNLGGAYEDLGQKSKALETNRQALAIQRGTQDRAGEATTLNNLGCIYVDMGRRLDAVASFKRALLLEQQVKDREGEFSTLNNLACVSDDSGEQDEAVGWYEQAVAVAREVGNGDAQADILGNLMMAWSHRHRNQVAIFYGKLAVREWQEARGFVQTLGKTFRASYIRSKADGYRALADLLIGQGRILEGEQVLGLLKDFEFQKFTRGGPSGSTVTFTPLEQKYHVEYQGIAGKLVTLGTEYDALQRLPSRTPAQEKRLAELDTTLQADRSELDRFMKKLDAELGSSTAAGTREDAVRGASDVQEALKDQGPGTAVIYVLVLPDHVREVLVTSSIYKPYEIPIKQTDLFHRVADFRRVLQNPGLDPRPAAKAVYNALLPPALRQDLAAMHPTVVAWWLDSRLRYIPINALYDGQRYLVERWRNTVFTEETARKLELPAVTSWRVVALGVSKAWGDFPPLPGVPEELHAVVHAAGDPAGQGDLPGTRALDAAFTSDALRSALLDRVPVVHIASHFAFRPGDDTQSFLLLGTGQKLTLEDIRTWRFSGVELLTLSACDTASGTVDADGHELESFAMLAQRAGARAVVASLWPVADRSTPALMREFYRLRAQHPTMPKIDALQQAQIALLHGTLAVDEPPAAQRGMRGQGAEDGAGKRFIPDSKAPYAHPYYWAPFILMGDWK